MATTRILRKGPPLLLALGSTLLALGCGVESSPDPGGGGHGNGSSSSGGSSSSSSGSSSSGGSSGTGLHVVPPGTRLAPGGFATFMAVAGDGSGADVTWSMAEANGGTVDATGRYAAPQGTGTIHLVATSKSHPS